MEIKSKLKLCSMNVENPFIPVLKTNCNLYDCPRAKDYDYKRCNHPLLDVNQIEEKKQVLWKEKRNQIIKLINHSHLIALQEMDDFFAQDLKKNHQNMEIYPEKGSNKKTYNVLVYDTGKWKIVNSWICGTSPILDLCDKKTQKTIRVASVHFTGHKKNETSVIGDKEMEILVEEMQKDGLKGISGCLIMGDFNVSIDSERCITLQQKYKFKRLDIEANLPKYTHTNIYTKKQDILDYIFFRDLKVIQRTKSLPKEISFEGENRVSDHIPVYGTLILNQL